MPRYAILWPEGNTTAVGTDRDYAEQLLRESSGPYPANRPSPRVVELGTIDTMSEPFLQFALESIACDGLPRVSGYTVDALVSAQLIEPTGDYRHPYHLTGLGVARTVPAPVEEVLF